MEPSIPFRHKFLLIAMLLAFAAQRSSASGISFFVDFLDANIRSESADISGNPFDGYFVNFRLPAQYYDRFNAGEPIPGISLIEGHSITREDDGTLRARLPIHESFTTVFANLRVRDKSGEYRRTALSAPILQGAESGELLVNVDNHTSTAMEVTIALEGSSKAEKMSVYCRVPLAVRLTPASESPYIATVNALDLRYAFEPDPAHKPLVVARPNRLAQGVASATSPSFVYRELREIALQHDGESVTTTLTVLGIPTADKPGLSEAVRDRIREDANWKDQVALLWDPSTEALMRLSRERGRQSSTVGSVLRATGRDFMVRATICWHYLLGSLNRPSLPAH